MEPAEYTDSLDPESKACLEKVRTAYKQAKPVHDAYATRWNEAYSLHRNHRALRNYVRDARDRDAAQAEVANEVGDWRADLCIPLVFSTIETIVPHILAMNPTMTVKPRNLEAVGKTKPIKELLEQQQTDCDFDLKLQPTVRRGLKYGLGVQKTSWKQEKRTVTAASRRKYLRGQKADKKEIVTFDGPWVEDVDIHDFFWDPAGYSVETLRWLIHRTWRDTRYVAERIMAGDWFSVDGEPMDPSDRMALLEAIAKTGSENTQTDAGWSERMKTLGFSEADTRAGRVHEIREYHDRENVYTIVNDTFVAQHDINPYWHRDFPFQIYRPTMQEGEFVGISEIEPIKHLQLELNTLRSQRRDNARFVLDRIMAYQEGMVDPKLLNRGPGALIPTVGDPTEVLHQLDVTDLPNSSYREEDAIKADFDRATGIDDSVAGAGAAGDTATGTQLVQQAASKRIAGKAQNLIAETIRATARQFHELNGQYLLASSDKKKVRIDDPQDETGYRFEEVDVETLLAEVEIIPDAGSTEPENTVQKRNDALTLFNQLNQNPAVDQTQVVRHLLQEHDISDTEAWLAPQENPPGDVLMAVAEELRALTAPTGEPAIPDERIEAFIEAVLSKIAPPEEEAAQQNGAAPVPEEQPA